jgi:hypothetical protein
MAIKIEAVLLESNSIKKILILTGSDKGGCYPVQKRYIRFLKFSSTMPYDWLVETDKNATFHRWTAKMYGDLSKEN